MDMIGHVIRNRYKLIDERGRGNFATVYIARTIEDNRIYAIKVLHPEHARDEEMLARFEREAHILMNLSDNRIVRILEHGNDNNLYYIVMDYIDGQNLKYYMINQGPLKPLRALQYARQITEGLDTAYKQRVVHRDIKPQNILVNSRDKVKITDFGLAKSWDTATLTETNVFMGTAYYVPPEQAESGHSADIRSDLYSVATVLFEMLTGKPPYEGETALDIVMKHMHDDIPSVCQRIPQLPKEMDLFMQKALAKSATDRFATPQEFITALEQLQARLQVKPSGITTKPVDSPIREAKLIMLSTGQVFPLKGEDMLVGREDPSQDIYPEILLPDRTVGRQQAYIHNQQGTYSVEALKTLNKTRVNGVLLGPNEKRVLKDGDILRFGSVDIRFELR